MAINVEQFKQVLKERTQAIATEQGWNWDTEIFRGYAFQLWAAALIADYEQNFDTEPIESMLYSRDLKADFVLEDMVNRRILVCQCKFTSLTKLPMISEDEVVSFFGRHDSFMNSAWVRKNGSAEAVELLGDYGEKVRSGYSVVLRFIATARSSDRTRTLTDDINGEYATANKPVTCELWDFESVKNFYSIAQSREDSVPSVVEIQLPQGKYFVLDEPYRTIAVALKGNSLRDLYKRYKDSLFAYNIRSYLGSRGVNSAIKETADTQPEKFYYFNNGISAICTDFDIQDDKLIAKNFQIINGAQTVGTLASSGADVSINVLFRLTEAESVKTEKGFNEEIIRYNNTQNVIKVSDFRANDAIQVWLERRFGEQKPIGVLPNLRYVRKRALRRGIPGEQVLKLEELAKIRYAYLNEPTRVIASPRDLWTYEEDGGVYIRAFGVNEDLESSWSEEIFFECLLAICLHNRYVDVAKRLAEKDAKFKYFYRLQWHGLALAGIYQRHHIVSSDKAAVFKQILERKASFDDFWIKYWDLARIILHEVYQQGVEDNVTIYSFTRSNERWNKMKSRMNDRIKMDDLLV